MTAAASHVTVGIDIGTTSVKAVAADSDGTVVARTQVPHEVRAPDPGVFEHDAATAWRDGVGQAWATVSSGLEVRGVTVAAMVPSLCAVDAGGIPITPGLLYGDHRGATASSANPAESGEFESFVRWTAATAPDAHGYWPAQAVANFALCGVGSIDTATAMTAYPLFTGTEWDQSRCAAMGIGPERMPGLSPGAAAIGEVEGGAKISGGTIDALGEQMVAGADHPGDVLVVCGTTMVIWIVTKDWHEVEGLWTVPHTAPGLSLVGGASNAGGLFLGRIRELLASSSDDEIASLDPDDVPVWLPYIRGERTPLHDPTRRAALVDLHVGHSPAAVQQAAYESAGFALRRHIELTGVDASRIVATGGGTRVAGWMQALADTTGLPNDVCAVPEGAALGAAFIARVTAGLEPDTSGAARWARTDRRVEPRPAWVEAAQPRYEHFRTLTDDPRTPEVTSR